jgi:hypothetical protein
MIQMLKWVDIGPNKFTNNIFFQYALGKNGNVQFVTKSINQLEPWLYITKQSTVKMVN